MKKDFFCETHNNHFLSTCIPCLNDIFQSGFGIEYQNIHLEENDTWDETYSFIEAL